MNICVFVKKILLFLLMFFRVCVHDRISGSKKAGKWPYAAHRAKVRSTRSHHVVHVVVHVVVPSGSQDNHDNQDNQVGLVHL